MTATPTPPVAGAMEAGALIAEVRQLVAYDYGNTITIQMDGKLVNLKLDSHAFELAARVYLSKLTDQLDAALSALEAARGENAELQLQNADLRAQVRLMKPNTFGDEAVHG